MKRAALSTTAMIAVTVALAVAVLAWYRYVEQVTWNVIKEQMTTTPPADDGG